MMFYLDGNKEWIYLSLRDCRIISLGLLCWSRSSIGPVLKSHYFQSVKAISASCCDVTVLIAFHPSCVSPNFSLYVVYILTYIIQYRFAT
jgi:hypothetical protein